MLIIQEKSTPLIEITQNYVNIKRIKQIKKPNLRKIRFWKKYFVYRKVCVTIRIIVLFHVMLLNLSTTGFPFFIAEY